MTLSAFFLAFAAQTASPATEPQAIPGDPIRWFAERTAAAESRRPALDDLRVEAIDRARWSTTTAACEAPIDDVRLYGLQPAIADELITNGILAGAFVGGWTFYGETGCAETPLLRYLYIAETDGRHLLFVVNRGEAISTPSMMRAASALAGAEAYYLARARRPECDVKSVGMRQTAITATDGNLSAPVAGTRLTGGWTERWGFTACGYDIFVDVRFDSDGKGGADARIMETRFAG